MHSAWDGRNAASDFPHGSQPLCTPDPQQANWLLSLPYDFDAFLWLLRIITVAAIYLWNKAIAPGSYSRSRLYMLENRHYLTCCRSTNIISRSTPSNCTMISPVYHCSSMLYIPAPPRNIANYLSCFVIPASILFFLFHYFILLQFKSFANCILLKTKEWGSFTWRPTTAQIFVRLWGKGLKQPNSAWLGCRTQRDVWRPPVMSAVSLMCLFPHSWTVCVLCFRWKKSDKAFLLNLKFSSKIIKWTQYQRLTFVIFFSELLSSFKSNKDYAKDKIRWL